MFSLRAVTLIALAWITNRCCWWTLRIHIWQSSYSLICLSWARVKIAPAPSCLHILKNTHPFLPLRHSCMAGWFQCSHFSFAVLPKSSPSCPIWLCDFLLSSAVPVCWQLATSRNTYEVLASLKTLLLRLEVGSSHPPCGIGGGPPVRPQHGNSFLQRNSLRILFFKICSTLYIALDTF